MGSITPLVTMLSVLLTIQISSTWAASVASVDNGLNYVDQKGNGIQHNALDHHHVPVHPVYPHKVVHHHQYQQVHKQDVSADKNEERVDLQPLRDFLVEFEDDPTGVSASLLSNIWNFLPQYTDVEVRKNFNKLKSGFDAAHFMGRDTVVWLGASLMWVVLHFLFWDGRVNTMEDLQASIQSPGVRIQLPSHADLANGVTQPDTSDDVKGNTFLETVEPERFWNFLTNPDTSTRRLYTNVFFGLASHLLWILPTFLGKVPLPEKRLDQNSFNEVNVDGVLQDSADDRIITLIDNLSTAPVAKNWNRLMSLQGVASNIGINFLNYFGKWGFWSLATKNII